MHPVDAALHQARQLLGTVTPPDITTPSYGDQPPEPPANWAGGASEKSHTVSTELDSQRDQIRTTHHQVAAVVAQANQLVHQADTGLTSVEQAWEQDKATLAPFADTPEGQAALLQAGQLRVNEATELIHSTATQYQQTAGQLQALTSNLPLAPQMPPQDPLWPTPPPPDEPEAGMPRSTLDGIHGTDSKDMPIITKPGELGPPDTSLFPGGQGWEEAYPGSGVWIPQEQISGKLFIQPPDRPDLLPPYGYEEIGRAPDGAILYWPEPSNYPQPYIPSNPGDYPDSGE